jgi:hypothetical protein
MHDSMDGGGRAKPGAFAEKGGDEGHSLALFARTPALPQGEG